MANEAIALLGSRMEFVVPKPLQISVSRDADEDNFLATSIAGECECIVTGDKDLLVLESYDGIRILSPREFIDHEVPEIQIPNPQ